MKLKLSLLFLWIFIYANAQDWQAPPEAKHLKNPYGVPDAIAVAQGRKIFGKLCAACHGIDGKGDPVMRKSLNPPPADLTSAKVQNQTDGEIFWKITHGKGMMASYANVLTEQERWQVVAYIRTLGNKEKSEGIETKKTEKLTYGLQLPAFPFIYAVNEPTTTFLPEKQWALVIQHRFGPVRADEGLWRNFLGLDLASNIRFSFAFRLMRGLQAEIGRTRYGKYYDFSLKYRLFSPSAKFPFSIVLYHNTAFTSEKTPAYPEGTLFADGRPFAYDFVHRLIYHTQVFAGGRLSRRLSGEIGLGFTWRNLAPLAEKNAYVSIPFVLQYKTGMMSHLLLEGVWVNRKRTMPLAIAYEISSSGKHVFQITLGNSQEILPGNILTNNTFRPGREGLALGFNLIRYF